MNSYIGLFNSTDINADTISATFAEIESLSISELTLPSLTPSSIVQTNSSDVIISSNILPSGCTGADMILIDPTLNGTVSTDLTPSSLIQTDIAGDLTASNILPSGCTGSNMFLNNPTLSGTIATSLSPSSIVQTNSSNNLVVSNTLPSGCTGSNMFLNNPTLSGTIATGLTAGQFVKTDISGNLTTGTITDITELHITPLVDNNNVFSVSNAADTVDYILVDTSTGINTFKGINKIAGANNSTKFFVENNSATKVLTVNTSTSAITTTNNTLDDGTGEVTLHRNLVIYNNGGTTPNATAMNLQFGSDTTNQIRVTRQTGGFAGIGLTVDVMRFFTGTPTNITGYAFISKFTNSSLNVVNGYKGTVQTNGFITYDISGTTGTHYYNDNVEIQNNLTVSGTTNLSALTASKYVKTDASKNLITGDIAASDITGNLSVTSLTTTGNINSASFTASKYVKTDASKNLITGDINASDISGSLSLTGVTCTNTSTIGFISYPLSLINTSTGGIGINLGVQSGGLPVNYYFNILANGESYYDALKMFFKPKSDNSNSFQIQNSAGTTLFSVNSSTGDITMRNNLVFNNQTSTGKFNITDSAANNVINVDNTAPGGWNVVSFDQTKLKITGLSGSRLAQIDASNFLTSSNTLPSSCSATSMSLTTPSVTDDIKIGTSSSTSAKVIATSNNYEVFNYITQTGFNGASGTWHLLKFNQSATLPGYEFKSRESGSILNIMPGYKGTTQTAGFITYDIPGVGTHYFWDNLQAAMITPITDNTYTLGSSALRWTVVYATTGTINTSDERQKCEIQTSTLGLDFIDHLRPVSYKWKERDGETKEPGVRKHYGLIAQEVKQVLDDKNIASSDFAGFIYDSEKDTYGLRYSEFISPMIKAIQDLSKMVADLKAEQVILKQQITELISN